MLRPAIRSRATALSLVHLVLRGARTVGTTALAAVFTIAYTSEAAASVIYAVIDDIEESSTYAAYFSSLGIAPVDQIVATVGYDLTNRRVSPDGRVSNTEPTSIQISFGETLVDLPLTTGSFPGQFDRIAVEDNATNPSFLGRDRFTVTSSTDLELGGDIYLGDLFFLRQSDEGQNVFEGVDLPTVDVINSLPSANFVSSIYRRELDSSGNIIGAPLIGRIFSTSVTFTEAPPTAVSIPSTLLLIALGIGCLSGVRIARRCKCRCLSPAVMSIGRLPTTFCTC